MLGRRQSKSDMPGTEGRREEAGHFTIHKYARCTAHKGWEYGMSLFHRPQGNLDREERAGTRYGDRLRIRGPVE